MVLFSSNGHIYYHRQTVSVVLHGITLRIIFPTFSKDLQMILLNSKGLPSRLHRPSPLSRARQTFIRVLVNCCFIHHNYFTLQQGCIRPGSLGHVFQMPTCSLLGKVADRLHCKDDHAFRRSHAFTTTRPSIVETRSRSQSESEETRRNHSAATTLTPAYSR